MPTRFLPRGGANQSCVSSVSQVDTRETHRQAMTHAVRASPKKCEDWQKNERIEWTITELNYRNTDKS